MLLLSWIGEIILFFVFWRLFHWLMGRVGGQLTLASMAMQIGVNIVLAVVLLIILANVHSLWWLMSFVGAGIGIFTGEMVANARSQG